MKYLIKALIILFSFALQAQELEIIDDTDTTFRVKITIQKESGELVTRLLPSQDSIGASETVADFLNSLYDDEARSFYNFEENQKNANQVAQLYRSFTGVNIVQSGNEALEESFQGRWRIVEGSNNDIVQINKNGVFTLNGNTGRIRVFSKLKIRLNNFFPENIILYSKDGKMYKGKNSNGETIRLIRR